MGGIKFLRTAFVASTALAATMVGARFASAQDAALGPGQVDFTDPAAALSQPEAPIVAMDVRDDLRPRFAAPALTNDGESPRRLELELAAGGGNSPIDVSIAQRATLGADRNGDLDRSGRGAEVRIGQGLVDRRENSENGRAVYMFVASEDEALTWQPGARSEFGGAGSSVALQDRVEVGDVSAGVTYEQNGVQASLAYVEREESTRVGRQNFNQDQSFTGVTVTMRR
ncbi:hypothetical protein [Vitreimonas flagellata]|uniref:hypothetical protein n=1 Tax=Vitreimonas flagellata TaxID=2560861 RepID=UPI0010755A44|nr:hypothetical protein [Vitreimonas flagellata]